MKNYCMFCGKKLVDGACDCSDYKAYYGYGEEESVTYCSRCGKKLRRGETCDCPPIVRKEGGREEIDTVLSRQREEDEAYKTEYMNPADLREDSFAKKEVSDSGSAKEVSGLKVPSSTKKEAAHIDPHFKRPGNL